MRTAIHSLLGSLGTWLLLSQPLHAALITFNAGTASVAPGGNVDVPITVDSNVTAPYTYWGNTSFRLTWDANVLTLQPTPVSVAGSPLPITVGNFYSTKDGQLNFTWSRTGATGTQVPDGSTLFTVRFTALGGAGTSAALNFSNVSQIGLLNETGSSWITETPGWNGGLVSVVPEPVNCALAGLGFAFVGVRMARFVSSRRVSR